jgi:hypothetical protein
VRAPRLETRPSTRRLVNYNSWGWGCGSDAMQTFNRSQGCVHDAGALSRPKSLRIGQGQRRALSQPLYASSNAVLVGPIRLRIVIHQPLRGHYQRKILSDPRPARRKDHCADSAGQRTVQFWFQIHFQDLNKPPAPGPSLSRKRPLRVVVGMSRIIARCDASGFWQSPWLGARLSNVHGHVRRPG